MLKTNLRECTDCNFRVIGDLHALKKEYEEQNIIDEVHDIELEIKLLEELKK